MKSIKAVKNIRLFKNAQAGKPKRVTTGVDDYGNRFHVVGGKVKHSRSLSENKKAARKLVKPYTSHHLEDKPTLRHFGSRDRREILASKTRNSSKYDTHDSKSRYHAARASSEYNPSSAKDENRKATRYAGYLHEGTKRKAKNFTK